MAALGLAFVEAQNLDYHMPYEDTEALIEKGLIKVMLPKGESLDENAVAVKADLSGLEAKRKDAGGEAEAEEDADESDEITEELSEEPEAVSNEDTEPVSVEEPETVSDEEPETAFVEEPVAIPEEEKFEEAVPSRYSEADYIPVDEETLEEEISVIEDEKRFAERIDDMIKLSIAGRTTVNFSDFGSSLVTRGRKRAELGFAFLGAAGADEAFIVAPYTREQYLAMPRKKKKSVQTSIKALLRYAATVRLIESLTSLGTDNARILQRTERLTKRLAKERKLLPTSKPWAEAVSKVTK